MDTLPPDPYIALGVPRDATQATIKSAYRKLALKFHPDKAKDKADEFHKVQTAYELIGSDESRSSYDADFKLSQLRTEFQGRNKTGPSPMRAAPFDMKMGGSSNHDPRSTARAAPRYDTQERRPAGASTYPSATNTPRPTNPSKYETAPDYFGEHRHSKAWDYEPPRKSSQRNPKQDEKKADTKKEKASSTAKVRGEAKKSRDKDRTYDRRAKAPPSLDSDDTDDDSAPYIRRQRDQGRDEFAYVRSSKRETKRSDDDISEDNRRRMRTRAREDAAKSSIRDYIARSKVEGPSVEKPSRSPPDFADSRRGSREDAAADLRSSSRPEFVRRSSKTKDRPLSAETPRSRPASRPTPRQASGRRSPSPDMPGKRASPSIPLPASVSAGIKLPPPDFTSRRTRTADEQPYPYTEERAPPGIRRSGTEPLKVSPRVDIRRESDTIPPIPSNLRYDVPVDSGYSTGNSPNDEPPPFERQPSAKHYRYVSEEDVSRSKSQQYQSDNRFTRSPSPKSPIRERDRERERGGADRDRERDRPPMPAKERSERHAPPPSRSATYAAHYDSPNRQSDSDRTPPASRRASMQREDSGRREDSDSRRRPNAGRGDSARSVSSRKMPDILRGHTMPLPLRTGGLEGRDRERFLFNEIRPSSSPINDDDTDEQRPARGGSPYDEIGTRGGSRRYKQDLESGHIPMKTSYGTPSRKASEDIGRKEAAERYMREEPQRYMREEPLYA